MIRCPFLCIHLIFFSTNHLKIAFKPITSDIQTTNLLT